MTPKSVDRIAQQLEERERNKPHLVTLSTGVVIRVKRIPIAMLLDITAQASEGRPTPPRHHIEHLNITEENYSDPNYIKAVEAFENQANKHMNDAFMMIGTELYNVPRGVPKPEDDTWADGFAEIGIEIPKSRRGRYLTWLKTVAMIDEQDFKNVLVGIQRLSGVAEQDVATATEKFPGSS